MRVAVPTANNFMQGDLGRVIVYGAPLRGSPLANALTHGFCCDDRCCYSVRRLRSLNWILQDTLE